ncbi:MAG: hypothetical protein ACRDEA_23485, partial [Microcystaceae cyanobacterium]
MSQLQIDPEFKSLIPPLSPQEKTQLEENLLAYGCRDSLVVWKEHNLLLDGHNRYEICQAHAIGFNTVEIELPERSAAISWIIGNQLGRRNLTPEAASYLRGRQYNLLKQQGKRTDLTCDHFDHKLKAAERLAKDYKVGSGTIRRDAKYAQAVDTLAQTLGEDIRPYLLGRNARLTKKAALELAAVVQVNPAEAQKTFEDIKTRSPQLSIAPHLQLAPGTLVEISAPNNPKIHERYGRVAAVGENRVDIWVRDTETMEMNKYQLKFQQVEAVPIEKEPQ